MRTEFKDISGIFYLVNKITLAPPNTSYQYENTIFKIVDKKVTLDFAPSDDGNYFKGAPVVYNNNNNAQKGKYLWNTNESAFIRHKDYLTNQFIEIIYKIYGDYVKYEADNNENWTLLGKIDNIQKIEYEKPDTILLRSAANN